MTDLKLVKSAPSGDQLIADALWGIAAAITESKPKGTELVVNASGLSVEEVTRAAQERIYTLGLREAIASAAETKIYDEPEEDVVNTPSHYRQEDGLECIDFNYDLAGPWFSVVRYVWRCMDKGNPVQDLEKALRYIEIAMEKGLEKPKSDERAEVFSRLWVRKDPGTIVEQRYFVLYQIFHWAYSEEDVCAGIWQLIDIIKEENA